MELPKKRGVGHPRPKFWGDTHDTHSGCAYGSFGLDFIPWYTTHDQRVAVVFYLAKEDMLSSLFVCLPVCLSVCLLATLRKNF